MAEKGDVPADSVSLPPTYAPSEAYTESPPPAYRREKSSRVAIVRMVCVTVVASALIIGFFILTSNYLNARACNCGQDVLEQKSLQAASFLELPRAGALVGLEDQKAQDKLLDHNDLDDMTSNDLDAGDAQGLPKDQGVDEAAPGTEEEVTAVEKEVPEVSEAEIELEEAKLVAQLQEEEEEEALQDIMRAQMDHMKKIRLPVDLILGNPSLAGRDVDCEVERRQQPLGGGIMTQAIIVTCHDNDEDDKPASGPAVPPPGPRRLGPPLSLLAPIMKMLSARAASRVNQRIVPLDGPRPMPFPMGPVPCPGPFPCIMSRSKQMSPPMPGPLSGPMRGPLSGPMPGPLSGPMRGPLSGPMPGPLSGPMPGPFSGPMPGPLSGPMPRPLSGPMPRPQNMPMPGPFRGEGRSLNPHNIPGPFRGPVSMVGPEDRPVFAPFNGPLLSQPRMDDGPQNRMPPFPFRQMVRMSPRVPRLLTAPEPKSAPISLASLHRGALPLSSKPEGVKTFPRVVPEARGRALPDPINLPGFRMLPGRLVAPDRPSVERSGGRAGPSRPITHMEMRAPSPPQNKVNAEPRIVDFGPPRVHTVIKPAQPNLPPQIQSAPRLLAHPRHPNLPPHIQASANLPPHIQASANLPPHIQSALRHMTHSRFPNLPPKIQAAPRLPPNIQSAPRLPNLPPKIQSAPRLPNLPPKIQSAPRLPNIQSAPRLPNFPPNIQSAPRLPNIQSAPRLPNFPPNIQSAPRLPNIQAAPHIITHPNLPHKVHPIHNSPIPKDIMTPPKPIAVIPKTIPIAGPQTSDVPPPPPPPPKFDPEGRSGIVPEINPDAEIVIKPQAPPQDSPQSSAPQESRKHHLLLVN